MQIDILLLMHSFGYFGQPLSKDNFTSVFDLTGIVTTKAPSFGRIRNERSHFKEGQGLFET